MKKLRLDLDALAVQSFETAPAPQERGTVRGNAPPKPGCTYAASCPCDSGYWACTTSQQTQQSCDYTRAGDTCDSFPTEVDPTCMCA